MTLERRIAHIRNPERTRVRIQFVAGHSCRRSALSDLFAFGARFASVAPSAGRSNLEVLVRWSGAGQEDAVEADAIEADAVAADAADAADTTDAAAKAAADAAVGTLGGVVTYVVSCFGVRHDHQLLDVAL